MPNPICASPGVSTRKCVSTDNLSTLVRAGRQADNTVPPEGRGIEGIGGNVKKKTNYSVASAIGSVHKQIFDATNGCSQVTPGSKAAIANVCIGDIVMAIEGENTEHMTHLEAQNKIKGCIDQIALTVNRPESKIWNPLVSEDGKSNPYKMNLAAQQQEIKAIGVAHNRSALPFGAATGQGASPKLITAQYNNPAGLYSTENIQTFNTAVESKTASAAPEPSKALFSPTGEFKAPLASVYHPLQSHLALPPLERRHSISSIPSQLRVEPGELKQAAQCCPNSPVEVDVPGLKVLHMQFNSPLQLYSQDNIMDSLQGQICTINPFFSSVEHEQQPASARVIDKDSEVYKMLQENQETDEPPRQSASFRVLQEILESEGDADKPSGFRSVRPPTTKVASSIGNAQMLPVCDKCGSGIVGMFVKIRDKQRHPECYVCTECEINLKQKGHFFVEDQIYCEKHARERMTPPEGYDVVTVFPKK